MANPKATLGARWMSETDVNAALSKARSNRQAQQRLVGSLADKLDRRRDDVGKSLTNIPASKRNPIINEAVAG